MFLTIVLIEVVICILLIIVVLMQSSKGGGLAGSFGGAQMGAMFGVRRTADALSKITVWLASAFIILSLLVNLIFIKQDPTQEKSIIQQQTPTTLPPAIPPSSIPSQIPQNPAQPTQ